MMLKLMAVLRSLYLIFIIGYTVRAMPFFPSVSKTFDEQYARCSSAVELLTRAAWFAIAWIALETAVGWIVAVRRGRKAAVAATPSPVP